ncbi:unnamed protein product [Rotaria socialis]|uniref:Thiamin pyrophosphokinase thiamin-binding domain-containing protein n=1 Tax=Rotaria socialis TaxID=392032 RepID=A0A818N636_9BILA|nr:unnamed protein product [Rotaria socialis]CAF4608938.1 unnamed protein product [Rotaria socialis]
MFLAMFYLKHWFNSEKPLFDHYPLSILKENDIYFPSSYGIIILDHSKSSINKWLTEPVWSRAIICACADGGSNELREFTLEREKERLGRFTPDFISGDFDSISSDTKQFYEQKFNVPLVVTGDQDATDFTKCLQELQKRINHESLKHIYVFCTFGGRFDQAMSIINTLYLYPDLHIFLISDCDITFLLKPGLNLIHQIRSPMCGKYCSLIPFNGPLKVVTSGLQWNLNEQMELNFTTLISTSNAYIEDEDDFVTISTHQSLIWSMTLSKED